MVNLTPIGYTLNKESEDYGRWSPKLADRKRKGTSNAKKHIFCFCHRKNVNKVFSFFSYKKISWPEGRLLLLELEPISIMDCIIIMVIHCTGQLWFCHPKLKTHTHTHTHTHTLLRFQGIQNRERHWCVSGISKQASTHSGGARINSNPGPQKINTMIFFNWLL